MDLVNSTIKEFSSFSLRKLLLQFTALGITIGSALMMWNLFKITANVESPIVVVLTASMEPAFFRGDILFVANVDSYVTPGDIMVFNIASEEIPIVHRAVIVQDEPKSADNTTGNYYLLTKGDNNEMDDRFLYKKGKVWLKEKDVLGKIKFYCPKVGYVTIMMNENPMLKYFVLAILSMTVLLSNDPEE